MAETAVSSSEIVPETQEQTSPRTTGAVPESITRYLTSLYSLHGKSVLITGATRGLGRQIAIALASAGADIHLLARSSEDPNVISLIQIIQSLGRSIKVYAADLRDRSTYLPQLTGMLNSPSSSFSPDIFVHSAGLQHRQSAASFPDDKWDSILEVNLTSSFLISRILATHWLSLLEQDTQKLQSDHDSNSSCPTTSTMRTSNNIADKAPVLSFPAGHHKKILLISSVLARGSGSTEIPAYVSTKGGITQLTKSLSNEWAKHGINVNAVAPGYFWTELTSGIRETEASERAILDRVPMDRWGFGRQVEQGNEEGTDLGDLEGVVVWLSGRGGDFVSGETIAVDGGFSGR